jgi:dihydroorotase/N-acyl-D-amino-acid deacylase
MCFGLRNLKNGASRRLPLRIVSGRSTLFAVVVSQAVLVAQSGPQFDILIRNGHVVDGTGSPWYTGDVAILNGRIAAIGKLNTPARRIIDASELVVAPGFIDMLGQSEFNILVDNRAASKLLQGVTT